MGSGQPPVFRTLAVALAISLGLILDVRSLAAVGSLAGHGGWLLFILLAILAALYCVTAAAYARLPARGSEPESIALGLQPACEEDTTPRAFVRLALVPLAARIGAFLFMGTSLLALAGYMFNEVFWRQFPNLGFSFLLLVVLAGFAIMGEKALRWLVTATGLLAALLMFALFAAALAGPGVENAGVGQTPPFSVSGLLLLVPLLVGFEVGPLLIDPSARPNRPALRRRAYLLPVAAGALLLALFGAAALHWVDVERLAATTVPHMTMARRALGDTGRMMMGAAGILTTITALGGLLLAVRATAVPLFPVPRRPFVTTMPMLLPCAAVAGLLGLGYAGKEVLEAYIAGAFGLWLAGYAVVNVAASRCVMRNARIVHRIAAVLFALMAAAMVGGSARPLVSLFVAALLLAAAVAFPRKR
ncbi:hypothetical protein DPQ33_12500 [Oceanidesulfovibrio indonesiensis]|uniref:Amino acid permease n=1 Tax=Oceanidesulfovibrio indonesiensis TaxID=54767 RepID=A0A7M3MD53_9BACT|nr:hypothetical protein [Oceanidesulfovibrio indonesiensis]TVM16429.1 hypothetical protein DPQ33_12500 [Oceanidesulfovibrio indonesiensis]